MKVNPVDLKGKVQRVKKNLVRPEVQMAESGTAIPFVDPTKHQGHEHQPHNQKHRQHRQVRVVSCLNIYHPLLEKRHLQPRSVYLQLV